MKSNNLSIYQSFRQSLNLPINQTMDHQSTDQFSQPLYLPTNQSFNRPIDQSSLCKYLVRLLVQNAVFLDAEDLSLVCGRGAGRSQQRHPGQVLHIQEVLVAVRVVRLELVRGHEAARQRRLLQ